MNFKSSILVCLVSLLLVACAGGSESDARLSAEEQASAGLGTGNVITYLVNLTPKDSDAEELYYNFNREAFVDSIFAAIYYHKARVTSFSGEPLSIEDVKTMEIENPKYDRRKLTGIQFTEEWLMNPQTMRMEKRVIEMLIGYEQFDPQNDSVFVAYWPGFIVKFD